MSPATTAITRYRLQNDKHTKLGTNNYRIKSKYNQEIKGLQWITLQSIYALGIASLLGAGPFGNVSSTNSCLWLSGPQQPVKPTHLYILDPSLNVQEEVDELTGDP